MCTNASCPTAAQLPARLDRTQQYLWRLWTRKGPNALRRKGEGQNTCVCERHVVCMVRVMGEKPPDITISHIVVQLFYI
jgi:hypothetical protein